METHAFGFQTPGQRSGGPKAISYQSIGYHASLREAAADAPESIGHNRTPPLVYLNGQSA
jgi:hypothetical protein